MRLPSSQSTRNSRLCILKLSFHSFLVFILEVLQECYQLIYVSIPHLTRLITCLASSKYSFSFFIYWLKKNTPLRPMHTRWRQDFKILCISRPTLLICIREIHGTNIVLNVGYCEEIRKISANFFYRWRKLKKKTRRKRRKSNINQNSFFSDEKLNWYYLLDTFLYVNT